MSIPTINSAQIRTTLIKRLPDNYSQWIVLIFFLFFLVVGVLANKDYGISWDEPVIRYYGSIVWDYVFHKNPAMLSDGDRYHGPIFEFILVGIEKAYRISNTRHAYLIRHLVTFLFFWLSVFFFFLLCRRQFRNWKIGLLGALFLFVSPRIFAHAFYNSKDLAFLSAFIIAVYTMVRFLDRKSLFNAVAHALCSGFLIDIRIMGVLVPLLTLFFATVDYLRERSTITGFGLKDVYSGNGGLAILLNGFIYFIFMSAAVVAGWPVLWHNPIGEFLNAFTQMKQFPHGGYLLFIGQFISANHLPWNYVPTWILVSVPLLYSMLFITGTFHSVTTIVRNLRCMLTEERNRMVALFWFFAPWIAVLILHPIMFDEWRHLFFIYPALIVLTLDGFLFVNQFLRRRFSGRPRKFMLSAAGLLLMAGIFEPAWFMIRNHPYEGVYFSQLIGGIRGAQDKFDLDYWGLSYRQTLEHIMKTDHRSVVTIGVDNYPGVANAYILSEKDQRRLRYTDRLDSADYHVTNFRWILHDTYDQEKMIYAVRVDGIPIAAIYSK